MGDPSCLSKPKKTNHASHGLLAKTALIIVFAFLCFVLLLNILVALHPSGLRGEFKIYMASKTALPFVFVLPATILFKKIASRLKYKHLLVFLAIFSLVIAIASCIFIEPHFSADAGEVLGVAKDITYGRAYIQAYPNNLGLLSLYRIILKLGVSPAIGMTVVNYGCYLLACFSLLRLCDSFSFKESVKKNLVLLLIVFLPFIFEIRFFYNDLLGIGFSFSAISLAITWRRNKKTSNLVLLTLSVIAMLFFRQNTLIPLVAILVYLVFTTTRKNIWKSLLALFLCLAPIFLVPFGLKQYYSSKYDMVFDKSTSTPAIAHIAMGTMDSTETVFGSVGAAVAMPGWWNAYNWFCVIQLNADCAAHAKNTLHSQLSTYMHNPRRGFAFIFKKVSSQWADATFLLPYAFQNTPPEDSAVISRSYYLFCEIIHLIILIFSLIGLKMLSKTKNFSWDFLLPLIAVFGYFLFSIIWEAKSRYIMLVFPLLLPFAAYGLNLAPNIFNSFKKKPKGNA